MADIIKGLEMIDSKDVLKYLKTNPDLIETNVNKFREELCDLNSIKPIILAFGVGAYKIIKKRPGTAGIFKISSAHALIVTKSAKRNIERK